MKLPNITHRAAALATLVLSLLTTTIPIASATTPPPPAGSSSSSGDYLPTEVARLTQGDVVILDQATGPQGITLSSRCTVGYIDHEYHRAWTAAHCGDDGTVVRNTKGEIIGSFEWVNGNRHATTGQFEGAHRDIAYINLRPDVVAGANIYSGDTVIDAPNEVATNTSACMFEQTTQRRNCGQVTKYPGTQTFGNVARVDGLNVTFGDSGGPIWVPGHGLLGVISEKRTSSSYDYILTSQPPN